MGMRIKGIGESSFTVIRQAMEGRVPDRLAALRASAGVEEASRLRALLRGDLVEIMVATATGRLDRVDLSWDPRSCCSTKGKGIRRIFCCQPPATTNEYLKK